MLTIHALDGSSGVGTSPSWGSVKHGEDSGGERGKGRLPRKGPVPLWFVLGGLGRDVDLRPGIRLFLGTRDSGALYQGSSLGSDSIPV